VLASRAVKLVPYAIPTLTLAFACASPPSSPPPAAPTSPLSAPPPADPLPPASAERNEEAPEASPSIDATVDPDELRLVQSICAPAIKHEGGKVLVGCTNCPPFEGGKAKSDAKPAIDPDTFFPLELVIAGSFTKPGASEIAAVFQGCESHAENYGGTLLLEKVASGFRSLYYASGVHPSWCKPRKRSDGRDLLVCKWADAHQGTGFTEVFVYDFARSSAADPTAGWTSLVHVEDTSFSVCFGISPESGVRQGEVGDVRFQGKSGNDLAIEIRHRRTPFSTGLDQKISKACQTAAAKQPPDEGGVSVDVPKLVGAPAKDVLELTFDGSGWKPTAKTAKIIKAL
jgi:hypothetical protein